MEFSCNGAALHAVPFVPNLGTNCVLPFDSLTRNFTLCRVGNAHRLALPVETHSNASLRLMGNAHPTLVKVAEGLIKYITLIFSRKEVFFFYHNKEHSFSLFYFY